MLNYQAGYHLGPGLSRSPHLRSSRLDSKAVLKRYLASRDRCLVRFHCCSLWIKGKITRKHHIIMGKSLWFPVKIFPPIHCFELRIQKSLSVWYLFDSEVQNSTVWPSQCAFLFSHYFSGKAPKPAQCSCIWGTYSFTGNGLVFQANFSFQALKNLDNVEAATKLNGWKHRVWGMKFSSTRLDWSISWMEMGHDYDNSIL